MFSKTCTSCDQVKDLNEFSEQRKHPGKLYAWCDECRRASIPPRIGTAKREYFSELESMREKSRTLMKFNETQVREIRDKAKGGVKVKDLATQYQTSMRTIYKVVKGQGLYREVK